MRRSVDLPAPLAPASPTRSPVTTDQSTSRSTTCEPYCLVTPTRESIISGVYTAERLPATACRLPQRLFASLAVAGSRSAVAASHLSPSLERARKRHTVGVFDVAAHRQPVGDTRHPDAERLDQLGEI